MNIVPFKNREIDLESPVDLYRCLNRKGFVFSLRQNGKVVGHTTKITLKDCEFKVNKSGKDRCISNKTRNVHAFVRGTISNDNPSGLAFVLHYEPYKELGFYYKIHDECIELTKSDIVFIDTNKIYCQL